MNQNTYFFLQTTVSSISSSSILYNLEVTVHACGKFITDYY